MAIKNFWSLQAGEAVVADLIKKSLGKDYQIFLPLNNQLKDLDLILINTSTRKLATLQVKESREFNEGEGDGLFIVKKEKVDKKVADFYLFLVYAISKKVHKYEIEPRVLVVPSDVLLEKSKTKKLIKGGNYYYYFNIREGEAFDDREGQDKKIDYTEFINDFNILKI